MEVIWTHEAERQLMLLVEYYLQSVGRVAANNKMQCLADVVSRLIESPHVGQFLVRRGQAYREVSVSPFVKVIYRVVSNKIMVVAVWDCRRDYATQ